MVNPPPRFDLPPGAFPVTIEALHPETRAVVWSARVERPEETFLLYIPPLKLIHGHPVVIRMRFADGSVSEQAAPPD
jgi:hypothetical protein